MVTNTVWTQWTRREERLIRPEKYIEKLKKWKDFQIRLFVLEVNPKLVDIVVHVQEEWDRSVGIKREGGKEYTISSQGGRKLFGAQEIRRGTITYGEHIRRFERANPQKLAVAFLGNGNLLFNPWFVAWLNGRLFCLKDEPFEKRVYSSLIVWKQGQEFPATIGDIMYRNGRVLLANGQFAQDITDRIECTTFGQRLVQDHRPIKVDKLLHQFYDLRHLLPALYYATDDGSEYAFGFDQLYTDEEKKRLAVMKQPVNLRLKINTDHGLLTVDPQRLRKVLSEADFEEVADAHSVQKEGQYFISAPDEMITIKYKPNIYPHSILGVTDRGTVLCIVVTGLSGRAGISIEKASELAVGLGVKDAILLANGGDVMMQYLGEMIAKSSENRRRLRSVLLFVKDRPQLLREGPDEMGIRLIKHTRV